MFSRLVLFINLSLSLILVAACSNDYKFEDKDSIVSLSYDTKCLTHLERSIDLYIEEALSVKSIQKDFKCVRDAIDYIQIRLKSKKEGFYNKAEVKNFLDRFLFDGEKKNLAFYESLLDLKSQVFGGEKEGLSFEDLRTLKTFLVGGEKLVIQLRPHASKLFFEKPFSRDINIVTAVRPLVQFLEDWFLFKERALNIKSVFAFLDEAGVEVKAQESWAAVLNLLRSVESEKTEVSHEEKTSFVSAVEVYYIQFLDLHRGFETDWEYKREEFFNFSSKIDSFLLEIQSTIKKHPEQKWSRRDLTHLMNLVSAYEMVGEPLSVLVQEHLVDVVFGKWFPLESKKAELNSENFQKIILSWSEINKFLNEAQSLEGYKGTGFPFVKEGTGAFAQFTQRRWPSLVQKNRTVFIPDYTPEVEFTFQSLFHSSWQFLAAKILIEAYSGDESRFGDHSGINMDQVKEAYLDVFVLLKEVGFLEEDSRGSWFRIFNEGNLFVPSADPDEFVSYSEAADYVAYMFSAYYAGDYIVKYMESRCPDFGESCSFNYVMKDPQGVFESLPGLWDYFVPGMNPKLYAKWQEGFEYIAKLANDDGPYKKSHWFRGSVANQYTEVIYRKYDLDKSDTLNFEEVSLAYVDFKAALKLLPMVKGTSVENDDAALKSFLTLFVKKGKAPKLRNGRPTGALIRHVLICGKVYTSENDVCTFESDRSKIISLLAYLTSVSAEF